MKNYLKMQTLRRVQGWMPDANPYQLQAGPELDGLIHEQILKLPTETSYPAYSTNESEANKIKERVEKDYGIVITTGHTRIRIRRWFARYEMELNNPTEVVAETYALAVCRLALLRAKRGLKNG